VAEWIRRITTGVNFDDVGFVFYVRLHFQVSILLLFVIYLRRQRGVEGATVDTFKCSSGQELGGGGGI
jgi:hypothetical protein